MPVGRRQFIGLLAGAAAGTAVGVPGGRLFNAVLSSADQQMDPPGGPEDFVLSVCAACPGGCGLRVRRVGGRVVKVSGNPLHPISGGRLCAKGQASIQALHHPDRVRRPLRRVGPRGSLDSFRPDSWDAALSDIERRLSALRAQRRPESLVLIEGASGAGGRLARRLVEAFGSPNAIHIDNGNDTDALALFLTQGIRQTPAYDLRTSEYVLSLGCEFLEAAPSPVFSARAYGDFRQTRAARRGKFIHVDPRLSRTGSSADEWIAIKPGTHGVFGLGVAAAIVAENLYDREFVAEQCAGFEDGLRELLGERFALESVAARTGVSVNTILRIAREFAAASDPIALGPRKGPLLPGRLFDHLAAHVLNALAGNIDQPGGLLVPDLAPIGTAPLELDAIARAGLQQPRLDGRAASLPGDSEQLADALRTGTPYRAEMILVSGADPVFTTAGDRFRSALEHVPFVVSFTTIPTDTALYSDWILPESHFLEQHDLYASPSGVAFASASIAQAALEPAPDVRPLAQVALEVAKRLHLDASFPWTDLDAYLRSEVEGLHSAKRGAIMGTPFDEAWVRMMEGAGWWAPGYATADELWKQAHESGGWWDPFYDHGDWKRVLRTQSGKFELRPDLIRQIATAEEEATPPAGALELLLFEPLATAGGNGAELPFLQSLSDVAQSTGWRTRAEVHPDTAKALDLRDGTEVRVTSPQGSIDVVLHLTDRIVRGAIAIPLGLGRQAGGRWAAGVGANPLRLVGTAREPVSSLLDSEATQVVVTPITTGKRS